MTSTLEAPPATRRAVLIGALAAIVIEIGLFAMLWRVASLTDPAADHRASLAFVALGTVLTLQAMAIVGLAWVLVAMSRTSLRYGDEELALEHPWRSWHGRWPAVRYAWHQGPWLVVEIADQWRRWYVWTGWNGDAASAPVRARVPDGAWLEGSAKHRHLARTVLPIVLGAVGLGGLALVWLLSQAARL